jgi:hypothetical protein
MKIIVRTGLFAFAVSLASLAACSSSNKNTAASGGTAGASTAGAGGTSETGGTDAAGMGGSSVAGAGGTSAAGASGAAGAGGSAAAAATNIKAADGGSVTADGLTVKIPPGALMADTDITVAVSDGASLPGAATLVAKVYDLGPTGTMFLKPVTLTFDYDAAKVVAPQVATVAFLEAGAWVALGDSATNGTKAAATTMHFTPYGVVITDPVILNCLGMTGAACTTCCETTFKSGKEKVIPSIIQTCACNVGALCNAQCASNVCMGIAITAECQACIQAETSKSNAPCFDQGLISCQAWSDCKAYEDCALSCM